MGNTLVNIRNIHKLHSNIDASAYGYFASICFYSINFSVTESIGARETLLRTKLAPVRHQMFASLHG
jgi:hypothetical protein